MNTKIKTQIETLAKSNPLEEICGFLYQDLEGVKIFECDNIAENKVDTFIIDDQDYLSCLALGTVCAIYHSHPQNSAFSLEDISIADEINLPILLYAVEENQWQEYIPKTYNYPLEGRQFSWGFDDCYGLVRSYYRQEKNVYLNDYDRDDSFQESDGEVILNNFEKEGFYDTNSTVSLQIGDVILFHSNRALPQHFGVFLGNSRFLHHPLGALSRVELLSGNWRKRIVKILRKKE
jgi:proteasome lid subunit RPN8/RPN11